VLTLLTIIHLAADQVDGAMATFLNELSMVSQFEDFTRGILNLRSVIYYVSMIAVFLFLAVRALEFRRWK
jgi:ABC-2 type transport system permease protein